MIQTSAPVKFRATLPMISQQKKCCKVYEMSQNQTSGLWQTPRQLAPQGRDTSVRFVLDAKRRLVVAKFSRRLTSADIENYAGNLRNHPAFDPSFAEIADISEVEDLPLEGPDFLKLADRIDPFSFDSKRAFVARTSVQRHAARMHKILRTQRNFEIFETLDAAERWIAR